MTVQPVKVWSVYMVICSDNTIYTGISNNVVRRVRNHNLGKGASYTKVRRPVTLVWAEECGTQGDALRREAAIKRLSRAEKLNIIVKS
jgi:putative endonuclease